MKKRISFTVDSVKLFDTLHTNPAMMQAIGQRLVELCLDPSATSTLEQSVLEGFYGISDIKTENNAPDEGDVA